MRKDTVKGIFTNLFKKENIQNHFQYALKDINFEIKKGEFFGIVGRNGSGKSTLLKILAGIYQPTSGNIKIQGRLVPFIELGVGFNPELSGRDNVYLNGSMMGFSKKEITAMYSDIVEFAELENFMEKKLKNYSSGMQVRLAFSMATRAKADVLLVDEVLAVGDAEFQQKCFKYFRDLKNSDTTVVFVSHDMNSVAEYCDRALLIEDSEVKVFGSSKDVSRAYTRMFMDEDIQNHQVDIANNSKRWGDGRVKYKKVYISPETIGDSETFKICTEAIVRKNMDTAIFGFSISNDQDIKIIGNNNKIKDKFINKLKKGELIRLEWTVPNIFNTGIYRINLQINSDDYSEVIDSWDDSETFKIERSNNNPYEIVPNIS
ncbi:MAG: ABC transporter ATP-binding protein, partial [Chitinophagia bacterium]